MIVFSMDASFVAGFNTVVEWQVWQLLLEAMCVACLPVAAVPL